MKGTNSLLIVVVCKGNSTFKRVCVMSMWNTIQQEMREVVWLASVVGGLSVVGVGLAVVVAMA